jgi:hypothetical protein
MEDEVVYNKKGMYEDENIIIVCGKDESGELNFLCHDKRNRDTLPLGACLWCGKDVG